MIGSRMQTATSGDVVPPSTEVPVTCIVLIPRPRNLIIAVSPAGMAGLFMDDFEPVDDLAAVGESIR